MLKWFHKYTLHLHLATFLIRIKTNWLGDKFLTFNLTQVIKTLKRALQPVISDVSIAWDLAQGWTVRQIPSSLPPLFSGDRLVVYGILKPSENVSQNGKMEVRLQGTLGKDEKMEHLITFSTPSTTSVFDAGVDCNSSVFVHRLAAKGFIQVQQDDVSNKYGQELEEAKSLIISVSKSANVVSKFTSFVAVDKENHQPVSGPLSKHVPSFEEEIVLVASCDVSDVHVPASNQYIACHKKGGMNLGFGFMKKTKSAPAKKKASKFKFPFGGGASKEKRSVTMERLSRTNPGGASFAATFQQTKLASSVVALISLQKASGAWDLTDQLVPLCGKTRDALITGCPIAVDTAEGKLLWATALALVLLMGKFLGQKDEWEMIAEKGKKWLKKNLPGGVKYDDILESAATAVGVQI